MQPNIVFAILLTILSIQILPDAPLEHPELRVLFCLMISLMPILLAHLQTAQIVQLGLAYQSEPNSHVTDQSIQRRQRFFETVWLFGSGSILFIIQWPQIVRGNFLLSRAILLDELLILAPIVGPLIVAWYIFSKVEVDHPLRKSGHQFLPARVEKELLRKRFRRTATRVRIQLALALIPTLLFFIAHDLSLLFTTTSSLQIFVPIQFALLIALFAIMPLLLRLVWRTESIANTDLGKRILEVSRVSNVSLKEVCLWRTDEQVVNAVVLGTFPFNRRILISDGMVRHFEPEEIDAIMRHESAHFSRKHLWMRLLILFLPVGLLFSSVSVASLFWGADFGWDSILKTKLSLLQQSSILIGSALYGFVALGWIARVCELDADLIACCTKVGGEFVVKPERLERYQQTLSKLALLTSNEGGWLHPSIEKRLKRIAQYKKDPQSAIDYLTRFSRLSTMIWAATILMPIIATFI